MLSLWRSPISHVRRQIDTGMAVVFPNLDREEPKGIAEYLLCFLKEKRIFSADSLCISDILNASFCHYHLALLKHECLTTRAYIQRKIFTMKQNTSHLAKLQRIFKKELLNAKHLI